MPYFYFESADQEGRKVSGQVVAETIDEARKKLRDRNLALFSLVQVKDEVVLERPVSLSADMVVYEFEGIDADGKIVKGRMEAPDEGAAYMKLRLDYSYELDYLVDASLSPEEKTKRKQQGIDGELQAWFASEVKRLGKADQLTSKEAEAEEAIRLSDDQEEQLSIMQKQIGRIIVEVSALLTKNDDILNKLKKREIEERLNLLSRLRQSNSIEHLRSLTDKLLNQLADDTIFLEAEVEKLPPEMLKRRKAFKTFAHDFNKKLKRQLMSVSINMDLIDPVLIKKNLGEIEIGSQVGTLLYFGFISFFGFAMVFWLFSAMSFLVGENVAIIRGYFRSSLLWTSTGIAAIVSLIFLPIVFSKKKKSKHTKALFFATASVIVLVFVLEFPVFFFWTH